ncbi:MAG TPA: ABC transporter permease [Chitinophagaceae bacterium]
MNLLISTRSELLKTKRSAAFWLSIFGALFIPVIFFLMYYFKPAVFILQLQPDPWLAHFLRGWQSLSAFLLPMFIILVCSLIPQIEYKNNAWKQVFASPQSLANIFFSKFITIHLMILFCFLLFNIFMVLSAMAVNLVNEDYPFFNHKINWQALLRLNFKTYISILGISAIQYWLSIRFKNFIVPIGIGLALLITAMIIMRWEHIATVPYAHPLLTFFSAHKKHGPLLENHELNSIGYFLVFTFLAFFDMKYRKERG